MKFANSLVALGSSALLAACSTSSDLPPDIQLVEIVDRSGDEIVIPYEKYVLDNGLTLILHHDDSDPLVHVDVTYHVGSAREEIGKSGFAHFFEHMMFQGSENVADEQHFKIVSESGGTLNGSTSIDITNYYQTVPKNQLEKILWLEADRMGFLLPAVTQEKFEIQRDTVKNERAQNYENKPYGLQFERTIEALYPPGHPYSWMTIGYVEDLDRVDVDDLKQFFLRWYGPNNATLSIGGDLDRKETLRWVSKYFGPIPRGPAVEPAAKRAVTLEFDRNISYEDNVKTPLLRVTIPTVYTGHPDEVALDALSDIIGKGSTSLLYNDLQRTGKAASAQSAHACGELACALTLSFLPADGYTLGDMRRALHETLARFEERGVTDDDLVRIKNSAKASAIFRMRSVRGKVGYLALMETIKGNPNQVAADVAMIDQLTKADIVDVYNRYVKGMPAVYTRVVPKGESESLEIPDNWTFPGRDISYEAQAMSDHLSAPTITDAFDRSVMPPAGPVPALHSMESWSATLPNGIEVVGVQSTETPTTAMLLRIETGTQHEDRGKLGVANLTAYMMNEATEQNSAEDLDIRLSKLSSTLRFYTDGEYAFMGVGGLTANFDETLQVAAERLLQPKFDPEDFDRWKKQALKLIALGKDHAGNVASNAIPMVLFGPDNHISYPSLGLADTVESIELSEVRDFYEQHYSPSISEILVISDLSKSEVLAQLEVFADWEAVDVPNGESVEPFPELQGGAIYLVDMEGAKQSEIRVASRSAVYDATGEHYRLNILNYALAGSFNSRVNLNIREDKGYSYGAFGYLRANDDSGRYVIQTSVRKDVTAPAIEEILREIQGVADGGMTAEELVYTRSAMGQNDALAYETPNQKVHIIALTQRFDLDPDWPRKQHEILMSISVDELNALANEHLQTDEMVIIVVGDKDEILEDLEGLDRPIIEIDKLGQPI